MEKTKRFWEDGGGVERPGVVGPPERAYAANETEENDLKYLIENSCITCDKVLPRHTVRILPPAYMQERDKNVANGTVPRRLMCVDCYNSMRVAHRQRMRLNPLAHKSPVLKEMVASFLLD